MNFEKGNLYLLHWKSIFKQKTNVLAKRRNSLNQFNAPGTSSTGGGSGTTVTGEGINS